MASAAVPNGPLYEPSDRRMVVGVVLGVASGITFQ